MPGIVHAPRDPDRPRVTLPTRPPRSLPIAPVAAPPQRRLPLADDVRPADAKWRPIYAVWEITLRCDLACRHCGSRAGRERPEELSTAEALDLVDQMADLGVKEVTLIGGEAYLREDWTDIARAVRARGMQCSITTGGRGLTPERARARRATGRLGTVTRSRGSVRVPLGSTNDDLALVAGIGDRALQSRHQILDVEMEQVVVDGRRQVLLKLERELAPEHAEEVRRRHEHPSVEALRAKRLVEHRRERVTEMGLVCLFRRRRGGERAVMDPAPLRGALPQVIARELARLAPRFGVIEGADGVPRRIVASNLEESRARGIAHHDPDGAHDGGLSLFSSGNTAPMSPSLTPMMRSSRSSFSVSFVSFSSSA